jgi:hypothetical protein
MKTTKLFLGIVAIAAMLLVGCGKDNNGGNNNDGDNGATPSDIVLANTTWQLNSPNDETYHGDVIYTVAFGQNDDVTFTRDIKYEGYDEVQSVVMTGTYTYSNGSGVAMIHNIGETTDYRITFTVSGNTLIWNFSLRDITLTKI